MNWSMQNDAKEIWKLVLIVPRFCRNNYFSQKVWQPKSEYFRILTVKINYRTFPLYFECIATTQWGAEFNSWNRTQWPCEVRMFYFIFAKLHSWEIIFELYCNNPTQWNGESYIMNLRVQGSTLENFQKCGLRIFIFTELPCWEIIVWMYCK